MVLSNLLVPLICCSFIFAALVCWSFTFPSLLFASFCWSFTYNWSNSFQLNGSFQFIDSSQVASVKPLAHQNVASSSLLYGYYFGRCSPKLNQLVPLPYYQGRSTCYSDRLHNFSVTISRCLYQQFLYLHSLTQEFSTHRMASFDRWSKWI